MTEITVIAAMDPNGVIGRTSKPCVRCRGAGKVDNMILVGAAHTKVDTLTCSPCGGTGRTPCNDLPWGRAYREDLARFKALTTSHAVIMGRRTWESLREKQRPLPGRTNIVCSRKVAISIGTGATFVRNFKAPVEGMDEALYYVQDEEKAFVIGGARLFAEALPLATTLELTLIGREWEGDVKFPEGRSFARPGARAASIRGGDGRCTDAWECVSREPCPTNADLTFTTWVRR